MKVIVQEQYIIPQSPEGQKFADEVSDYLLIQGVLKDRKEDTEHIYVSAEGTLDVAERKDDNNGRFSDTYPN